MAQIIDFSADENLESSYDDAAWQRQLETLRALAQVVNDENLSELEIEHGGVQITLKAPSSVAPQVVYAPFSVGENAHIEYSNAPLTTDNALGIASKSESKAPSGTPIVTPMVGLFYRAPSPNDPNFVEVGDHIEIGQTVGLVETMKVFNEITSEIEGTVTEIKALSGALVETGDVLMTIG